MNCIKDSLLNYEATGLDYIHEKNVKIDDLFYQLGFSKTKSFTGNKKIKREEDEIETKKQEDTIERSGTTGLFNRIIDMTGFKRQEVQEKKDSKQLKALKDELYDILSEQCVLCGDFMVDSIQCSLSLRDEEELKKSGLNISKEPEFSF